MILVLKWSSGLKDKVLSDEDGERDDGEFEDARRGGERVRCVDGSGLSANGELCSEGKDGAGEDDDDDCPANGA